MARVEMERALAEKDAQLHAALEDKVAAESQRASAEARLKILGRVIEEENERAEKAEAAGVSPRGVPALVFGRLLTVGPAPHGSGVEVRGSAGRAGAHRGAAQVRRGPASRCGGAPAQGGACSLTGSAVLISATRRRTKPHPAV